MDERIQEGSFTRLERSFKLEKRPAKTRRAGVSAERTMVSRALTLPLPLP